ncbi:hypothetical protein Clacol_008533 [Clathrus columnatus]|uniref:Uncharacterized protein n=1 Tax=Clathrus columnatus TaxID=1419009 RepID=A0AAV5AMC4_9AGAM|nr:hypothetical protein Clacol_008533 [Clathrus columnatus]
MIPIIKQLIHNYHKLVIVPQKRALSRLSPAQRDHITNWLSKHEFPLKQEPLLDQLSIRRIEELACTLPTLDGTIPLLSRRLTNQIRKGIELSPGHSLVFCNPVAPEKDLESDATISVCPPPEPFVRRMWASGSFRFLHPLYLGDEIISERSVKNIDIKRLDSENPMVIVEQEIATSVTASFDGSIISPGRAEGPCIIETRSHVYIPISNKRRSQKVEQTLPESDFSFTYIPTDTTLFRFSALTFNAHRIHLDKEYARNVEGLNERLVHGPMTALMLLEVIENNRPSNLRIDRFEYRATSPLFINSPITIAGKWTNDEEVNIWAHSYDNVVGMKGRASLKRIGS